MSSSQRKSEFLGMAFGTAAGRLRKNILFNLVQKCGEDVCFRCGQKIESVDDLSIEHKKPWEGRSVELYWDMDNIAFSHIKCNLPHTYNRDAYKKVGPKGTVWCSAHKQFLPEDQFSPNPSRPNGYNNRCKACRHR